MILKDLILMFKKSADKVFNEKDYTSATILYFKTWFAIQDFFLLNTIGQSPKDLSERFRVLEQNYHGDYKKLDKEFSTYRDTYSKIIDKETCERIKNIVENELINKSIIKKDKGIPQKEESNH